MKTSLNLFNTVGKHLILHEIPKLTRTTTQKNTSLLKYSTKSSFSYKLKLVLETRSFVSFNKFRPRAHKQGSTCIYYKRP